MKDTIIIVEDNYDFGSILSESIKISFPDYNVEWFRTGVATAEAIDGGLKPICGIIDTILPDSQGMTVARYILEAVPEAKLISMTAHASHAFEVEAFRYGTLEFIIKPFSIYHIRNLIENAIDRYKISKRKTLLIQDIRMMMEEGQTFQFNSIFSLVTTLEQHSKILPNISLKITEIALKIGEQLALSESELKALRYTALLYDLGKISDEEVFIKSKKSSASQAGEIYTLLKQILPGIRSIYEAHDGSGFPGQLKGDSIPLFGRILSVAHSYISLTIERLFHKPLTSEEALEEIQNSSGKLYNPDIVEALAQVLQK